VSSGLSAALRPDPTIAANTAGESVDALTATQPAAAIVAKLTALL